MEPADYDNYSYDENDTGLDPDCSVPPLHGSSIFLPVVYYLIFFSGILGNMFVIFVVGRKGRKGRGGRLVDTFIANLALADLVFVSTLPLWATSASHGGRWTFGAAGNLLCKLSSYVIAVNRFSNIFFLTCMSIDRYLAVVKLLDSRYLRSSRCIHASCGVVWVSSLVLGVPSLMYRRVDESGQSCVEDGDSAVFLGLSLAVVLLTFVVPVSVIALSYGTIILHLNRHCAAAAGPRAAARRRHSLKMVLCIVAAFVVSWLPFNVFKVVIIGSKLSDADLSCEAHSWLSGGLQVSCCLAFLNSCVNPAIYFFLDHHFRRQAALLLAACGGHAKLLHSHNSSATSESFGASGRSQLQLE